MIDRVTKTAMRTISKALKGKRPSSSDILRVVDLQMKAGMIKYSGTNSVKLPGGRKKTASKTWGFIPFVAVRFSPVTPTSSTAQSTCGSRIQGKIAWDYKGSKRWNVKNVARLCRGVENSGEPGKCFNRAMHGRINWGNGTRWRWENAVDLCERTANADATIGCFQGAVGRGMHWSKAIAACGR